LPNSREEVGLTVGGFYKHFDSRDELVTEALRSSVQTWKRQKDAADSGGPPFTYESLVNDHLSEAHLNHPGAGCPVSALAEDIARSDKRIRTVVTAQISEQIDLLANLIRGPKDEDKGAARSRAIRTYCALVGAISTARAVSDEYLSREILVTVKGVPKESPPKKSLPDHFAFQPQRFDGRERQRETRRNPTVLALLRPSTAR